MIASGHPDGELALSVCGALKPTCWLEDERLKGKEVCACRRIVRALNSSCRAPRLR